MTSFNEGTAKNTFLEILQSKQLPLEVFTTEDHFNGFKSHICIEEVFGDTLFYGDVRATKKEAEKSAALAFLNNTAARLELESYHRESVPVLTESGPPKNRILEILQGLGLNPNCAVFTSRAPTNGTGFYTTLQIPIVFGDRMFQGAIQGTKKDADRSAAMAFLNDSIAVATLKNYHPANSFSNNSVFGSSVSASLAGNETPEFTSTSSGSNVVQLAIRVEVSTANGGDSGSPAVSVASVTTSSASSMSGNRSTVPVATPVMASSAAAFAAPVRSTEVLTGPPKNHILEILQRRGYLPGAAHFSAHSMGTGFQGRLQIPAFFGERIFTGDICATKKEAELKAAMTFINDAEAMHRLRTFNP